MEQVVQFLLVLFKTVLYCIEASIKALLPVGILPRKDVKGQTVLITGSGSGIGRLMAVEFAKLGCVIVLWDINEKGNNETKEMIESAGVKAYAYTVNLAKREEIYATADKVKKEVGNVDILINNAGVVTGKKLFDCPDDLMELTMAVNTNALFYTGKSFIPSMLTNNKGHIVTVASIAGKVGVSGLVDYCSSKHGAIGFHESITNEIIHLKKDGVKTTVVCPFYIDTGMFDGAQTKSPTLLPILEPNYVVDNIIEAVLTNREFVALPKFCYVVNAGMSIFPSSVCHLLAEYFGTNETMENFTGRKQKN